jgi:S1-C subfamily serine protease
MTEEQNDQTTEGPAGDPVPETPPTAAAPEAASEAAIPMPAVTPPTSEQPLALPQQPDTPPMGMVPDAGAAPVAGSTPPQGTYAMGALAGNPMLGDAPPAALGSPPPTDPGAPMWSTPPQPAAAAAGSSNHRVRNGLLAGAAALAVLGAGIGIGHATSNSDSTTQAFSPTSGGARVPSNSGGSNSGGSNSFGGSGSSNSPFGNGSPFGNAFGNSGSSGNTGNGSSGSSKSSGPSDVNAIASKIDPGLVDINTTLGYQQEQAAGTGIVLSSNGVILTNNHVIDGATSISVTDIGNHKTYTASVVGYDRTKDIAVLQLHNASGLQTATLGNSSNVSVGQDVVGVGNAGGTGGTPSAAGGTVTALNQSITASDEGDGTSEQLSGLIETNADIQPGDSGGALVDTSGNVVGIDTAASAGFSFQSNNQSSGNQGYAIPINAALALARAIEAGSGSSTIHIGETAFLGVEISAGDSSSSGASGNSGDGSGFGGFFGGNSGNTGSNVSGASVASVVTNGPAQEAGLAEGDVITSLGGKTINTPNDVTSVISTYHPGDKVTIGWTDGSGQTHTASVQLSQGPPQ